LAGASVCGSAAALRYGCVPAVTPPALHFLRSPTADRANFPIRACFLAFKIHIVSNKCHFMSEAAVITLVIVLVSAAAAIAITVKIVVKVRNNKSNNVNQTGNTVGGDQAGRDINKK
jgi:hypothetical protein